jgi:5-formyltetrahydrofolate cyclo-ligase
MTSIPEKIALRDRAIAARGALRAEERRALTERVGERALAALGSWPSSAVVGLYVPIKGEINPNGLGEALAARGHRLALPATPRLGQPLVFRAYAPGDTLVRGRMNIPEPSPEAPEIVPQILIVPPVAFDRRGYRIGYGAGFYDRTLPVLRAIHPVIALGFAFACQEVPAVPDEPHDVPLDMIATEAELIPTGAA